MQHIKPHWALEYIRRPWQKAAQGPDAFDCWGLVRYIQCVKFALYLPAIIPENYTGIGVAKEFRGTPERSNWRPVATAQEGDIVEMSHGTKPHHVGIWIDANGGGVLHCLEGVGVVFDTPADLRRQHWNIVSILRHTSR